MNKQRFIVIVLLVSLVVASGPSTIRSSAAPPPTPALSISLSLLHAWQSPGKGVSAQAVHSLDAVTSLICSAQALFAFQPGGVRTIPHTEVIPTREPSLTQTGLGFSAANYSVREARGTATITVTLDAASSQTVTVDYATSDGTTSAGSDYLTASGMLTFAPGVTSQTFTVSILDDTLEEPDETITLTLSNPTNSTLRKPKSTTLTILADDNYIYLPFILKRWPPIPYTPVLNTISNPDGDGNYTVNWERAGLAESYTLEEDTTAAFSSPTTQYTGSATSWYASGKPLGTYYYRVKASNSWGASGWSNIQSVSVHKLYPTADTTVLQGYPTFNFGSTVDMWVGYDHCSGGKIARSLIRFDVSSIPAGTSISQARLYLFLMGSCDIGERTHRATVYRTDASWSSSWVTWNTQPGYAEAYGSASIPSRTWGWYSFDVTNLVRGWVNGSFPNYGLAIRGPESSGNDSATLEFYTLNESGYTYDPYLDITFAGMTTSEEEVQVVKEIPNLAQCGPTVKDVLSIFPGASDFGAPQFVEQTVCSPD